MIDINKNLKSYKYAVKGLKHLLVFENNARIHLAATVLVLALSAYFRIEKTEWLWILLAITLVWTMELINTAIEKIVDFLSPEFHPAAGKIKDLAAAAVLIAAIFALIVGVIIFQEYMF
ncbi:DeoR family transcriptional regulator [Sporocytophaga myxococcoides]|uniref:DeoR family transcriptional regulator n=1 Tax=Sporocytophaga myxococcoides TaxID=153721 RepID=A0A098L8E8_9BACT|nr:diacylglycerol kinase family protein [Sporocytophaga myxococcoides]GAL82976.1 DeoR family transcriptional regulator [Sporocytophaga myxococcoides]